MNYYLQDHLEDYLPCQCFFVFFFEKLHNLVKKPWIGIEEGSCHRSSWESINHSHLVESLKLLGIGLYISGSYKRQKQNGLSMLFVHACVSKLNLI